MAGPMPGLLTLMEELYGRINKERLFGGGVRGAATRGLLGAQPAEDMTPAQRDFYENAVRISAPAQGLTALKAATVFHGSPAKFKRFDPTKIGSGEGAQAYGYGHYVAEVPTVAESYAFGLNNKKAAEELKKLSSSKDIVDKTAAARLFYEDPKTLTEFIKSKSPNLSIGEIDNIIKSSKDKFEQVKQNYGNVYKIDLPDEQIARMLDFDKPLNQQSSEIQALAKQYGLIDSDHFGGDLVAAMGAKRPSGAEKMRQAGVPGIRFLDQGSRSGGKGTSNFVVFPGEEELLRILERNGVPITSLLD